MVRCRYRYRNIDTQRILLVYLSIYVGFYVAFNTVQVISRRVVERAEETSTHSSLGFCTVNCWPTASNFQLSHLRLCREWNPGLRGGRRECYHSATVVPRILLDSRWCDILFNSINLGLKAWLWHAWNCDNPYNSTKPYPRCPKTHVATLKLIYKSNHSTDYLFQVCPYWCWPIKIMFMWYISGMALFVIRHNKS